MCADSSLSFSHAVSPNILIIKLGALGDFVLADAAMQAIKKHYPDATFTLLTTPPFVSFAEKMGHFDHIFSFERFSFGNFLKLLDFVRWIQKTNFTHIFDLQMVDRTRAYYYFFKLFSPTPFRWIGHVRASSYFLEDVYFNKHVRERFERLLSRMGIPCPAPLDLRRMGEKIDVPGLSSRYILMVPSASMAFGGAKIWPLKQYNALIPHLTALGYDIVVVGGKTDDHRLLATHARVFDLTGKTSFHQLIYLATHATAAIGGDTGPMHMAAAAHAPVFCLFSKKALPAEQVGPRAKHCFYLTANDLNDLSVGEVHLKCIHFLENLEKNTL